VREALRDFVGYSGIVRMIREFKWKVEVEYFGIIREEMDKVIQKEEEAQVDPDERRGHRWMMEGFEIASETSQGSSATKLKKKSKFNKKIKSKKLFPGESKHDKKKQLRKEKQAEKEKFLEQIRARKGEQQADDSG